MFYSKVNCCAWQNNKASGTPVETHYGFRLMAICKNLAGLERFTNINSHLNP